MLPLLLPVRTSQLPSSKGHDVLPTVPASAHSPLTCQLPKAGYVPNVKLLLCTTQGVHCAQKLPGGSCESVPPLGILPTLSLLPASPALEAAPGSCRSPPCSREHFLAPGMNQFQHMQIQMFISKYLSLWKKASFVFEGII